MTTSDPAPVRGRPSWPLVAACYAILVGLVAPLVVGTRTLYLRDLLTYHYSAKVVQARAMGEGFLPLVDPQRAGGQALVGNLNNVALYPDNLLYLVASPLWALNAHMWLHLLLAPVGVYWLARRWDVGREAAWAAGFVYAASGFFLSHLNLYNLVAGAAIAPAFVAACMALACGGASFAAVCAAGLLWAAMILAGEPLVAAAALIVAVSACLVRRGATPRSWALLGAALAAGTLVAAPQIVELLRILPDSYRTGIGYSPEVRLRGSWDPRSWIEILIPLFFGEPGHDYWGSRLSGSPPLYYSVYPGLLALALLGSLRRPREPVEKWGWALVAVGAFAALGGWNPLVFWILRLPAAASLRYPVKGLLLVAVGGALLCAVALERCRDHAARVRVGKSLGVLAVLLALLLAVVSLRPDWIAGGALFPLEPTLATASLARWRALLVASLALAGGLAVLVLRIGRWRWATVALVALHVGSQALLLRPLADTDDAAAYRLPPPALDLLQPGDRVLQACALLAGCGPGRMEDLPDTGVRWLQRRAWTDLHPLGGAGFGVRYAFNTSPEGLDTLLPSATRSALDELSDAQLLRLLAASSVDVLLLNRPIDPALADAVRLRGEVDTLGSRLWVYEVAGVAAEERLVAGVEGADLRSVLGRILADDFDPHGTVVLPGYRGPSSRGPNGRVEAVSSGRESWSWSVDSSDGGLLVLGRAYLSLYEARVDDVPAEPLAVNAGQLAIPVPPGRHRVDLAVDRTPFRRALVAAAAGLVLLVLVGRFAAAHGGRREARGRPRGASGGESPG